MDIQKLMFGMLFATMLFGVAMANPPEGTTQIAQGLCQLYFMVSTLLAVVVFILIVVAAIVYAGGQILGAETRARASVWATSMIIGAIIGIVIYVLMPVVLGFMLPAESGGDLASICAQYGG